MESHLKIGIHLANGGPGTTPNSIIELGTRAEADGYDSVWVSDHVVVPSKIDESKYPYGPPGTFSPDQSQNIFEPFGVLAFLAGATRRIKLGTSVMVLPQRQPLVMAKQWSTLDALSRGRTILGVGAGWMREEFEALQVDTFDRRGPATDEAIRLFRSVWGMPGDVSFYGQVYRFDPLRAMPKPHNSTIPIWIGGHGKRSVRRAAELGDGWHAVRISLADLAMATSWLRDMVGAYNRSVDDIVVSTVVTTWAPGSAPSGTPADCDLVGSPDERAAIIRRYAAAGIQYLVVGLQPRGSAAGLLESYDHFTREVLPLLR
jgi:probable F420-dependent oxidoreductase